MEVSHYYKWYFLYSSQKRLSTKLDSTWWHVCYGWCIIMYVHCTNCTWYIVQHVQHVIWQKRNIQISKIFIYSTYSCIQISKISIYSTYSCIVAEENGEQDELPNERDDRSYDPDHEENLIPRDCLSNQVNFIACFVFKINFVIYIVIS